MYIKKPAGNKIRKKTNMIPEVNIISGKVNIMSMNRAGGSGRCTEPCSRGFRGRRPLRKFLVSKEYLDWLKIDLNAAEIITVQDYCIKAQKINVNGSTHIQC